MTTDVPVKKMPDALGRLHKGIDGEKMSRWISWVLKAGYTELGMAVSDGWVKLAELAGAAQHCLRGHEQLDGAQLIETPHKSRIETLEVDF